MIEVKDFSQYQQLALRTLSPGYTRQEDIMHAIMGMCGEIGELLEHSIEDIDQKADHRIGEVGDCFWYCAVLAERLDLYGGLVDVVDKADTWTPEYKLPADVRAAIYAAQLMEMMKKWYFYKKEPNFSSMREKLILYVTELVCICDLIGVKPLTVAEININKLATRYPNKFDADKAINRDYEAESKAAGVKIS